jgi:TetR/AcrR family transcriptional regulator of autoinduction and epiphytic fitness
MGARPSIRDQLQRVRQDAIVGAVNRLLATKGYDAMTVDEVAAEAGLAKASLYKFFTSKEELAGAAMVGALDRALAFVDELRSHADRGAAMDQPVPAIAQLKAVARWAMATQLEGEMPSLPAHNSSLSGSLQSNDAYMDRLLALSNRLSIWITEAQTGASSTRRCRPNWCSTHCSHAPAIRWWPCSRSRANTPTSRSLTGSRPPPLTVWP